MRILRKLNYWWYRGGVTPRLIVFAIGAISIAALIFTQFPREQVDNAPSSVMFFLLVNLNIVLLGAFAVLIGRNVFKLLVDRRNKILGARLRTRLVLAFVGLSLVPTAILFAFASGFITDSVDDWFNSPVEVSVEGAVEVSRSHHVWLEQYVLRTGKMLARQVESKPDLFIDDKVLESFLAQQAREFQLDRVSVLAADQKLLFSSPKNQSGKGSVEELGIDPGTVKTSMRKGAVVLPGELGKEHLVTSYVPLNALGRDLTLVASVRVSPDLVYTLNSVVDAFNEYKQLKTFRQPLKSGYLLTLTMITCLILFSAIWLGFYIARELSGPIQRLAEGTREVARGNYDFRLKVFGDDEISSLVRSFNRMTLDLKSSRKESEERRIYLESMLANMGVGVIAVDGARQITLVNSVARDLFKLNSSMKVVGHPLKEVLEHEVVEKIEPLISRIEDPTQDGPQEALESIELLFSDELDQRKILCSSAAITGEATNPREASASLGTVLLFDDITQLAKVQAMAAWREVARRIAHEIKNPLTPLKLSAQRLERVFAGKNESQVVSECTQTILEHVESIKRLANEFSQFARMPEANLQLCSLNTLVSEAIAPYAEEHDTVTIHLISDNRIPDVRLDLEQVRRMIINLLDNAVAATESKLESSSAHQPKVVVKTGINRKRRKVFLEISDNGVGISNADKQRIFDPYFTTKKDGTGLGLAIVMTVVREHQGSVRVLDNAPQGTKFVIEFPYAAELETANAA